MKKIVISIVAVAVIAGLVFVLMNRQKKNKIPVIVHTESDIQIDKGDMGNGMEIQIYNLKNPNCEFSWQVRKNKESGSFSLQLRYNNKRLCENYEVQKADHELVLKKVFENNYSDNFAELKLPALIHINPTGEWNVAIANLATKSEEWVDFDKNYPYHKSRRKGEPILADIANQANAFAPFLKLFDPYANKFEIKKTHVIFRAVPDSLVFKDDMDDDDVDYRVLYDGGMYEFNVYPKADPNKPMAITDDEADESLESEEPIESGDSSELSN